MKKIPLIVLFALTPLVVGAQDFNPACFCVSTARQYATTSVPRLDAEYWNLLPSGLRSVPTVGGIVLFKYWDEDTRKWVWHVAVIKKLLDKGFLVVEGNYVRCKVTERFIPWNDGSIVAFFRF